MKQQKTYTHFYGVIDSNNFNKKTTAHQLLLTKSTEINILPQAGMLHKFPEMQT